MIEKVIQLVELENDLANLVAQANQINGAVQYIKQKIAELKKLEEKKPLEETKDKKESA